MRDAEHFANDQIAFQESVGPAQRPHCDVMRRPRADAGDFPQPLQCRLDVAFGLQDKLAGGNATRKRDDCACARKRHPDPRQSRRRGVGKPGCGRKESHDLAIRRGKRFTEFGGDATQHRTRAAHRDLLPDDRADGELETIERSRDAEPGMRIGKLAQRARDDGRVARQVECMLHARQDRWDGAGERRRNGNRQRLLAA